MKIAVIGTGIAGNVAAYYLSQKHHITVFEANDYVGGHTHSHELESGGKRWVVDSGFIVFNQKTYPNFIKLLKELDVPSQLSAMSFSVKCEKTGLEYNGTTLNSLFAQRKNLISKKFYRMIMDILRFNKDSQSIQERQDRNLSLAEFLQRKKYSSQFIEQYIIPMGAAIWSAQPKMMMYHFPAYYFVQFLSNHGMLSVNDRPDWHVIKGGSREYVNKLIAPYKNNIRLSTPVKYIMRYRDSVDIATDRYGVEHFDYVFIATHSDQALKLLSDASTAEHRTLGAIPYQENIAVIHTDTSLLPERKLAWAAWNYHILKHEQDRVALTYNMNILQGLKSQDTFCVTLNNKSAINEKKIIKEIKYHHPVFTPEGVEAQQHQQDINGSQRTFYCGAYWRYGFHEDGVISALNALKHFEDTIKNEKSYLHWRS